MFGFSPGSSVPTVYSPAAKASALSNTAWLVAQVALTRQQTPAVIRLELIPILIEGLLASDCMQKRVSLPNPMIQTLCRGRAARIATPPPINSNSPQDYRARHKIVTFRIDCSGVDRASTAV